MNVSHEFPTHTFLAYVCAKIVRPKVKPTSTAAAKLGN